MIDNKNIETIETPAAQVEWWHALLEFLIHIVVGTTIFLLIGTPAVALDMLVSWLKTNNTTDIIVYGLQFAEYMLFFADLLLFTIFIVRTVWRIGKKL